jgi:hypothetical protein
MIFKTGHKDFPSLVTYTDIMHNDGGSKSAKAAAYAARFLADQDFVEKSKVVKLAFEANEIEKKKDNK